MDKDALDWSYKVRLHLSLLTDKFNREMVYNRLAVQKNPSSFNIEFLADRILDSLYEQTNVRDCQPLGIFQYKPKGKMISGLYGWTWGECFELLYIWVDKPFRGKNFGTSMYLAAEHEAKNRKCKRIIVDVHTKSGFIFFKRLGFKEHSIIQDYPIGHSDVCLIKEI